MKRAKVSDQSPLDCWVKRSKATNEDESEICVSVTVDKHNDDEDNSIVSSSNEHSDTLSTTTVSADQGNILPDVPSSSTSAPNSQTLDIGMIISSGYLRALDCSTKMKLLNLVPDEKFNQSEDGVYCKARGLFAPADVKGQKSGIFVNKPIRVWTKHSSSFNHHETLENHRNSMTRMTAFKVSCSNPTQNVATMLSKTREEMICWNMNVMKSLLKCVAFCGKQGLSFRGHRDDSTTISTADMGNFIELIRFRAESDEILKDYLKTSPKNTMYTSKTIQNEIIDVIGNAVGD
uniref:DUF4371 domain-containing protein n=1 Tax=Amphimedon queenslandica TaxID=400682 RepID=A0A1X7V634_AMPQE